MGYAFPFVCGSWRSHTLLLFIHLLLFWTWRSDTGEDRNSKWWQHTHRNAIYFYFLLRSSLVVAFPQFDDIPFNNHSTGVANRLGKHPKLDELCKVYFQHVHIIPCFLNMLLWKGCTLQHELCAYLMYLSGICCMLTIHTL